ncbi:MAG: hypothetical protein IPK71_08135 [Myxococcales bacterium]|jgi:hypothetical protein|nr:hypothetical protein [Myxococcales bacterium]
MSVDWNDDERSEVEGAIKRFPVESGKCAALARVVARVGISRDPSTRGRQIKPRGAARFVVPKHSDPPRWVSHTFVDTHRHVVDALTGASGCPSASYLATHWEYADALTVQDVDVEMVDPGIQEET